MTKIITLLLVALSVGLGNFAASVAIGSGGVTRRARLKVAVVFGVFETGMPIVGLLIGQKLANTLGNKANIIGGSLLLLAGTYILLSALRKVDDKEVTKVATAGNFKLLIAGLSLSIDNLVVGFSLGTSHQPLVLAIIIIGLVSISLALLGLELGRLLSKRVEEYSEILSGIILILVGLSVGFGLL